MGLYESQVGLALHARRRDVRAELEAQYNFISSRGVEVDHADNHCATLYGINGRRFYIDAYNFCAEHSLPYRFPKTPGFLSRQIDREAPGVIKCFQKIIVGAGERRGVGLLGRGVPCRGTAQPCGGAHRPEREILVVFQFRKAVQHFAEDFPFGILCAALVLQYFQAVEIETRLYRAEQFALRLGISPATAREQQARVLVQHSKSPLGLRAAPQNDMVLPQHSFSFYSIVYAQTVVNLQDGKFTKKL